MKKGHNINVSYPVTVQFEDVDSYKIAHHTKLIAYLERARVALFQDLGHDLSDTSREMVLYNLNITFKKTARFLDHLTVSAHITSTESFRFTVSYKIKRTNELIAKASTDIAFVDAKTKEIIPVPHEFTV